MTLVLVPLLQPETGAAESPRSPSERTEQHATILLSRASGSTGEKGNDSVDEPAIAASGRAVAFWSVATNLHPDKTDGLNDIFARDFETHETILVSRADGIDGAKSNGHSHGVSISADGRYVAFVSQATNLHPEAPDTVANVYRRDLETHEMILVDRANGAGGPKGNGHAAGTSISADGRYVAFASTATNIHPDKTDGQRHDVFVRDLVAHETILVSRASGADGVKGNQGSGNPSISSDGRALAFESLASNIHPDKTDILNDVFVRDLTTHETILVSRATGLDGVKGNGLSIRPSISRDGRQVAFSSTASNLHPDATDLAYDVYARDLDTHDTTLVSRAGGSDGEKGDALSVLGGISGDGRYVSFWSAAGNIHPDKTDRGTSDVFVRDLVTHELILASRADGAGGDKGNDHSGQSGGPVISDEGRYVAFDSVATNLHPDDSDAVRDLFLRDLLGSPVEQPELTITPASLDFGDVEVGATSPPQTATLQNTGTADATGILFALTGGGFHANTGACGDLQITLPPGASCAISVTFAPSAPGGATGTLSAGSAEGAAADLELAGNGIEPGSEPIVEITPTAFELEIPAGSSETRTLSVGNLGTADLHWDLLAPAGLARGAEVLLFDNGPLITHPGEGPDGTDHSTLQNSLGMGLGGANASFPAFRIADDFEVLETWDIDTFTFYVYQTGSGTTSTITAVNYQIWDGPPHIIGSNVVFGDTGTNRLASTDFSSIYRVSETTVDTERPIMRVVAEGGFRLEPGTYWVDAQFEGSLASGPFQPPVTILGATTTGNALQANDGLWQIILDIGLQGIPFLIQGIVDCWDPLEAPWLTVVPTAGTVSPGTSQSANVTADAMGLPPGDFETTLCVRSNDPNASVVVVPVKLTVVSELSFDPASLDFEGVAVGSTSPPLTGALQNIGEAAVSGLTFSVPGSGFEAETSACGDSLPPGGSCAISVTFTPTEPGAADATLEATGVGGNSAVLELTGFGVGEPMEHETILVSRASGVGGAKGDGWSSAPTVSGDGRRVAFQSTSTNLHPDAGDTLQDIFVRDLDTHATVLVSRATGSTGEKANNNSRGPVINATGRYVAFESFASNLHPDDADTISDIFVRDLMTDALVLASRASGVDGAKGNQNSEIPSISASGRIVAFGSDASNLHPDDPDTIRDIFARNLETHELILVSRASGTDGIKGDSFSFQPAVSASGRHIAFVSNSSNLHPDDTDDIADVFVRDLETHETILVSRANGVDGAKGNERSFLPKITADGRYVAFHSRASNLHPDKTDDSFAIFVRDLHTEETVVASRATGADGAVDDGQSTESQISSDGRYVGFRSSATNLHPDDTDTIADLFVRDLLTHDTVLVSRASGSDGVKGNAISFGTVSASSMSADGRYFAFFSRATNLHPDDTDDESDVFVRDVLGSAAGSVKLVVTPDLLDFGDVEVGSTSEPLSATIQNVGDAGATGIVFGTPGDGFDADTSACGSTLPAGASCSIDVAFTPSMPVSAVGTLTVESAEGATADLELSGNGVEPAVPLLAFAPPSLDFGDVEVGSTSEALHAMLENTGKADVTALDFGIPTGGFDVDASACDGSLPAGESCAISITFAPSLPGPAKATLGVTSQEGATATLDLAANGVREGFSAMALSVDSEVLASDGNQVLEPGEQVEVAPAWRNDGTVAQDLTASIAELSGPDGADYFLVHGEADYGRVEPTEVATCADTGSCYEVGVSDPAERPATRWVATFDEVLSDGSTKTWNLHLGDSFVDVPRSSPFYRSIETMLHHEVTGGCGETEYCPTAGNTRGQMPVFVLRALEGHDFVPEVCAPGDEVFADVPATSGLCPWIQALSARGVVAGCGEGIYCPNDPVNRQQMAIFLLRTLEGEDYTPPACKGLFEDMPCSSVFTPWVEELANRGVTGGCSVAPALYCPTHAVNRQQMAVFVSQAFELELYGP